MARNITISFEDGTSHQYANVPDNVTPEQVQARASGEFGNKAIVNIDGGNTTALPDENKSVVEPAVQSNIPVKRELDAQGRTLVPNLGEPTFAESAASGIAKFMGSPEGFSDQTVDNYNDFAAGATSMNRGIGNLVAGEGTFKPKDSPTGAPVDKSSGRYLAGNLVDPTSWAVMGGASKLPVVGKSMEFLPVTGKGKVAKALHNTLAGSSVGGTLGALSEDGTALGGSVAGAFGGAVLPSLASAGNAGINYGKHLFQNADIASGRFANKAAEASGKRDEIIDALMKNTDYTGTANAGQAAAKAGSAEFSALQEVANARHPTPANTLLNRQEAQRASTIDSLGRDEEMLAEAIKNRAFKTKPLYDEGVKVNIRRADAAKIAADPVMKDAITKVMKDPLYGVVGKNKNSVEVLDAAKKYLDDVATTMGNSGSNYASKLAGTGAKNIAATADAASRAYAQARQMFKEMSGPVNKMEVGQYLANKLKTPLETGERASVFASAVKDAPKTIKNSTGMSRFDNLNQIYDKTEMSAIDRVSKELMNDAAYKELAKKGMIATGDLLGTLSKPVQSPNLLSAPIATGNAAIRLLKGKITEKTLDALSKNMQNPQKLAELMQKASVAERGVISDALVKAGILGGINATNMQGVQ